MRYLYLIPTSLITLYFLIYRIVKGQHLDWIPEVSFNEIDYPLSYPLALWWSKKLTLIWEGNEVNYFCAHAHIYKTEGRSWGFSSLMSYIFHPYHCEDIYTIYYKEVS